MRVILLGCALLVALPAAAQSPPPGKQLPRLPAEYQKRLDETEAQVLDFKMELFERRAAIERLAEEILYGTVGASVLVLLHENELGASFTLQKVRYLLDGKPLLYRENDDEELEDAESLQVYRGPVDPGLHELVVEHELRGNGPFFTYVEGYRFKLTSRYVFHAEKGRLTRVAAVAYERGDATTPMDQRPYLRYSIQKTRLTPEVLKAIGLGE